MAAPGIAPIEVSTRAIDLVAGSTVIDMLGLLTMDWRKLWQWCRDPDAFAETDFKKLQSSGVKVFHPAVDSNATNARRAALRWLSDWNRLIESPGLLLLARRLDQRAPARGQAAAHRCGDGFSGLEPLRHRVRCRVVLSPRTAGVAAHLQHSEPPRLWLHGGRRQGAHALRCRYRRRDERSGHDHRRLALRRAHQHRRHRRLPPPRAGDALELSGARPPRALQVRPGDPTAGGGRRCHGHHHGARVRQLPTRSHRSTTSSTTSIT